ncbi:hypothetical protein C7M84_011600 [Penaeus vannamei]|uniref:Uncharacterized protein n=1 Tax=Penaeus vannamei TaxID=6689 RepID=A0A3R7SPW5_PENVA|nr:hypothetical protein C7M84_011600 [Penaeus vannamei]
MPVQRVGEICRPRRRFVLERLLQNVRRLLECNLKTQRPLSSPAPLAPSPPMSSSVDNSPPLLPFPLLVPSPLHLLPSSSLPSSLSPSPPYLPPPFPLPLLPTPLLPLLPSLPPLFQLRATGPARNIMCPEEKSGHRPMAARAENSYAAGDARREKGRGQAGNEHASACEARERQKGKLAYFHGSLTMGTGPILRKWTEAQSQGNPRDKKERRRGDVRRTPRTIASEGDFLRLPETLGGSRRRRRLSSRGTPPPPSHRWLSLPSFSGGMAGLGVCRVFLPLPLASHRSGSRKCAAYISEANFETHFLRRKEAAPAAGSVSAEREWYRNRRPPPPAPASPSQTTLTSPVVAELLPLVMCPGSTAPSPQGSVCPCPSPSSAHTTSTPPYPEVVAVPPSLVPRPAPSRPSVHPTSRAWRVSKHSELRVRDLDSPHLGHHQPSSRPHSASIPQCTSPRQRWQRISPALVSLLRRLPEGECEARRPPAGQHSTATLVTRPTFT